MKKIFKVSLLALMILSIGIFAGASSPTKSAEVEPASYVAVITQGSTGATVKTIQRKLKNWGYYKGEVDGIFGAKTKEAVKYFQRKNGLKVDGIVGKNTLKALGISSTSGSQNSSSSYSDSDLLLLARLIYGEARGESYMGQVAVGAVVLNRIKSPSFPNTMAGVIYQRYAFTAVEDGQINLTPNATAKKAAQDALNGWDPSYGSLYYYNPSTATSQWIFSRKTITTIGNHVFAI